MGELLTYSGTTTKIRAMKSRLLTDNDYRNMASMTSVSDALVYLKKTPGYGHLLADQDETHKVAEGLSESRCRQS